MVVWIKNSSAIYYYKAGSKLVQPPVEGTKRAAGLPAVCVYSCLPTAVEHEASAVERLGVRKAWGAASCTGGDTRSRW